MLFYFTIAYFIFSSCSSYKIVSSGLSIDSIQSLASRLDFKSDKITPKSQYSYVLFYGLSDKFQQSEDNLDNALVWDGNTDYFEGKNKDQVIKKISNKKNGGDLPKSTTEMFCEIQSDKASCDQSAIFKNNSACFIQLGYYKLINFNAIFSFNYFAKDLIVEVAGKEGYSINQYKWPSSISQIIVEKVWELRPISKEASLVRNLLTISDKESIVLMSNKISLKVDTIMFYSDSNEHYEFASFNYYYLGGKTTINFLRDQNAMIKQTFL